MPALPAARLGDSTGHSAFGAMSPGSSSGARHGAVLAHRTCGGARGAAYGGAIAEGRGGGMQGAHIARAGARKEKQGDDDQSGPVKTGSPNVLIGGLRNRAARAGADAAICPVHRSRNLVEGSATVWINTQPAARASEKLSCTGGRILSGSATVLIGGDTISATSTDARPGTPHAVIAALAGEATSVRKILTLVLRLLCAIRGDGAEHGHGRHGGAGASGAHAGAHVGHGGHAGAHGAHVGGGMHGRHQGGQHHPQGQHHGQHGQHGQHPQGHHGQHPQGQHGQHPQGGAHPHGHPGQRRR